MAIKFGIIPRMSAQLIDGKMIADTLLAGIAEKIKRQSNKRAPSLTVILVGNNPASDLYVKSKAHAAERVGIHSQVHTLPENTTENELASLIDTLNANNDVDGILVQLPLPFHINQDNIVERIDPRKDVDGFHPYNLGRLTQRRPFLRPCTPYGIMLMLEAIGVEVTGKHAVVVGASNIVGRPMVLELLLQGATVTDCHRFTRNLSEYVKQADILISATGKSELIKGEWIKPGSVVIDVGISRLNNGEIVGDVEFEAARKRAAFITPVRGGVGPMTVAVLMHNTMLAAGV